MPYILLLILMIIGLIFFFAMNPEMLMMIIVMVVAFVIWVVVEMAKDKKKEKTGTKFNYTTGTLFMTLYPCSADQYKYKALKVYRRTDGSAYYTEDDGYKHDGTPVIFAREVKRYSSGMDLRTGLGNIEVSDARIERVELSPEARKIHEADPLFQKYVRNGQIACRKDVQFSDATLSAYSRMDYSQRTQFASLYAYDYQQDYKVCKGIETLLRRIADGVTPEQAAKVESRSKTVQIVFYTICALFVAAYLFWYYFY